MQRKVKTIMFVTTMILSVLISGVCLAAPSEKAVLSAMKKATEFMANEFSYRGGYC